MSSDGAAPRAAVPVSNARAEASRKNGAKSRGPKTPEGKARSAQNALKHGMRALKYVVLPDEDAVEFQALEAALLDELAPEGALQLVLARRVAVAAWRLARADRMEVELFEERRWEDAGVGMALIRDGNGTRSFETLLRYRGAAMAEFWRALKTLKALQAEQAACSSRRRAPISRRSCPSPSSPRRRRCARSRPDRQRAARTPIAADRTNPSASWPTCCPNRPSPAPPCTSPPASTPRRPEPNEPEPAGAPGAGDSCIPSGRSCERRRAHTIGSGRRRAPDSAW